ncbi:MAG: helix-turn-helix transcriptional regulator [Bacteroidota bacterium]
MKLYIKNMACVRCETMVKMELEKLGLPYTSVRLGEIEIERNLSTAEQNSLNGILVKSGLELLNDKKNVLVEKIIGFLINLMQYDDGELKTNLSTYLHQQLDYDYDYLSRLFSEVKGTTIEHFFIMQRIERAKELLLHQELNLSEIADKLHFSSMAHFCNQFKKHTGLTPSYFRRVKLNRLTH